MYRTTDGGQSWTQTFANDEPTAFYDCMAFFDRRNGLALSDPVDGKFRVLSTSDGGASWSVVPPDGMPPALTGEFAFAASGQCITTYGRSHAWIASGGGATARVFHSDDRGHTWSVHDTRCAAARVRVSLPSRSVRRRPASPSVATSPHPTTAPTLWR